MDRLEYKYLVSTEYMARLRKRLSPFVEMDQHASRGGATEYTVRSIYFDTLALDYYHQKEAGLKNRRKIRIRGYGAQEEDSTVFLEIKRKDNMAIDKKRIPVRFDQLDKLFTTRDIEHYTSGNGSHRKAVEDAQQFFYHMFRYSLHPVILVTYDREAFYCKFDTSVRITFDKDLRSLAYPAIGNLFDEGKALYAMPGYFIVELKFNHRFPSWSS